MVEPTKTATCIKFNYCPFLINSQGAALSQHFKAQKIGLAIQKGNAASMWNNNVHWQRTSRLEYSKEARWKLRNLCHLKFKF